MDSCRLRGFTIRIRFGLHTRRSLSAIWSNIPRRIAVFFFGCIASGGRVVAARWRGLGGGVKATRRPSSSRSIPTPIPRRNHHCSHLVDDHRRCSPHSGGLHVPAPSGVSQGDRRCHPQKHWRLCVWLRSPFRSYRDRVGYPSRYQGSPMQIRAGLSVQ